MGAYKIETTELVERWRFTCDFCGRKLLFGLGGYPPQPCVMCGRYGCQSHGRYDPHPMGDHPDWYCNECWKLGEPFRVWIEELESQQEQHRITWKNAAVAAAKAKGG